MSPGSKNERWAAAGVCLCLAAMVWVVFGQTPGCNFINYDDDTVIYQNAHVMAGLSLEGVLWAFKSIQIGHWDPLTTLTHMFDCQMYGLHPWGHHLTNVLLHGAAAILLFLAFLRLTGTLWRSAFVAAVWAVHPLRVESVAWISERKDVLSGVFFMLILLAYESYVRKGGGLWRYLLVVALFACGVMSKSMLVTLPIVLLLLDWWPLGRLAGTTDWDHFFRLARPLILEKIPMLVISGLIAAIQVMSASDVIVPIKEMPISERVANALVSYVTYVWQMVWPVNLAIFYPHPRNGLPLWETGLALITLILATGLFYLERRKCPWLMMGWLWYLGMLVPVIGIVQSGELARADRYTYLPQIGLSAMLAWTGADLGARLRFPQWMMGVISAVVVMTLMSIAWNQTTYWHDSEKLWTHALDCTRNNDVAHNNLGNIYSLKGDYDEALSQYQAALQIKPDLYEALGNIGVILSRKGELDEAIAEYQRALTIKPDYLEAHYNLGVALTQKGELDEAIAQYLAALKIEPALAQGHFNLANALSKKGESEEAIAEYQRALQMKPDYAEAANDLAYLLASCSDARLRNGAMAEQLAEQANQITGGENPVVIGTLAAAYAEEGRFPEAVETAKRAIQLAEGQGNAGLAKTYGEDLKLYEAGKALRE